MPNSTDAPRDTNDGSAALLVVDVQNDFLLGGALAVRDGDTVVGPIAALMRSGRFPLIVGTQDWHPPDHASFASAHAGRKAFDTIVLHGHAQVLWPVHCVAGGAGAAFSSRLPSDLFRAVIRKGTDREVDSYSGFRNNFDASGRRPPTGLAGFLRDLGVTTVHICGLARDYCVRWSAEDAIDAGFRTVLLWDLTRSVDPTGDAELRQSLVERGVAIAGSPD